MPSVRLLIDAGVFANANGNDIECIKNDIKPELEKIRQVFDELVTQQYYEKNFSHNIV